MSNEVYTVFGACLVSRNIYERKGNLKWCIHENGARDIDNGWRFLSDIDTDEYLADVNNWCILTYESVIEIEPAVLAIYDMPVGTELTFMREGKQLFFLDTNTGKEIHL